MLEARNAVCSALPFGTGRDKAMSNRQLRLQELVEAERRIAQVRRLIELSHYSDRAISRGGIESDRTLDNARADWLTLEFRRLEILHESA
jgi:hypothetical protein